MHVCVHACMRVRVRVHEYLFSKTKTCVVSNRNDKLEIPFSRRPYTTILTWSSVSCETVPFRFPSNVEGVLYVYIIMCVCLSVCLCVCLCVCMSVSVCIRICIHARACASGIRMQPYAHHLERLYNHVSARGSSTRMRVWTTALLYVPGTLSSLQAHCHGHRGHCRHRRGLRGRT